MHNTFAGCLCFVRYTKYKQPAKVSGITYLKARDITPGETPQKSLILPPVHISVNSVFALNIHIFYKNLGNSGGTFCQKS